MRRERAIGLRGIGVVSQAKDGSIGFTLLCQKVDARFDPFVELFSDLEPGKLVEDRTRYNISGHDSLGIRWRCERQMLGVDQGQELRLTSNLTNLVAEQKSSRKELEREYQGWYFSGDLKMPTRPHSKKWEHERGSTSWKGVIDHHGNSELSFHAPQEGFKQRSEDFLRGVAMLCGRPLSPMCAYRFFGDRQGRDLRAATRPSSQRDGPFCSTCVAICRILERVLGGVDFRRASGRRP